MIKKGKKDKKNSGKFFSVLSFGIFFFCLLSGCGKKEFFLPEDVTACNAEKGMYYAEKSVSFGDRYSGSEAIGKYGDWIVDTLKSFPSVRVWEESFRENTPSGILSFRNIIAEIPGESADYVIAGAHYDTKKFESFSFAGANDGASGAAALLLIGETLSRRKDKLPYTLRLVFFDGEECQVEYGENDGLHGSKYHAANLEKGKTKGKCRAMILLDMIGDKDLCIAPPVNSHPLLVELLKKSAAYQKKSHAVGSFPGEILDDHVPFMQMGIPCIDLIDFSYGADNVFWHTPEDTLDKISGSSIALAADLTIGMLFNIKRMGL